MYKTAITMFASLLTAFSVGGCAGDKGDSYRVEDVGGVPRLMFNGEPVRPRMLYVSPTYFMLGSPTRRNAAPYAYTAWTDTFIEIPAMKSAAVWIATVSTTALSNSKAGTAALMSR